MDRALATVPALPAARRVLRVVAGTAVFVGFGMLGRATVIDESALSLAWPAAGIAALWFASGDRRTWPGDVAALALATCALNLLSGATFTASLVLTASNVLQVFAFVYLAARWFDDVWGLGGVFPLHRLSDLGRLVVTSVSASLLGAIVGAVGLALVAGGVELSDVFVWWGRNSVSLLVITAVGLLVGPPLFAATDARDLLRIVYDAVHARTIARLVEAELLVAVSVGLYALIFGQHSAGPLSFLVLAVSIWAGLRFPPVAVMLHGLAMGAAGIVFTLHGEGPFAAISSTHEQALVAQVFVATTVLTGLSLAFSRTERDRAIQRLAQARVESESRARLLGAVLESMGEGLVVVEEGGEILVANSATRRLFGLAQLPETMRSAAQFGLFHEDGTPLTDEEMAAYRALRGEEVPATDHHLRVESVPEGRVLSIGARSVGGRDPSDPPLAMVNIRDVTLDRQHRDALSSFAGVVAHDLFNPLSVVTGWAESLEEAFSQGPVPPTVGLPMVARLDEAASHMRRFIGDLLNYTIARDQSLRPGVVDLSTEIERLASLRVHAPGHPVITVAPGLAVWADVGLVRQLFDNLIGNALKYVPPGVRPEVTITGDPSIDSSGDWLEIRVADNGIGIPNEQRELVFESFHRAHADRYQGTGLGLAICRRIADRHGGSIHVEDGPGGLGTTFVVRLPSSAAGYAGTPAPAAATGETTETTEHSPMGDALLDPAS
jgi:signal transduction histidine kinase